MRKITVLVATMAMLMTMAGSAVALQRGDFIGKGEVQTFFEWNNRQLQDNANRVLVTAITTTEWTCSRPHPTQPEREQVNERSTEVTTSATTGARERNQVTGFFVGDILGTQTSGPGVGSCPSGAGAGWTFDEGSIKAGDTVYSFALAS